MVWTREVVKKVCMLGDPAVGKTSIVRRYVLDDFDDKYIATIGTKVMKREMEVKAGDEVINLIMMIHDIVGQRRFHDLHEKYFEGAEGTVVVCDLTRKETIESIPDWLSSIYKITGEISTVCLANKVDLITESESLSKLVDSHFCPNYFTSAKTGTGVEDAFKVLADEIIKEFIS